MINKKSIWKRWYMIVLYIFIGLIIIGGLFPENSEKNIEEKTEEIIDSEEKVEESSDYFVGDLIVHYIDVGQGDATLIQGPNYNILIDAGRHNRNDVISYLTSIEINEIRLLVGTHPHEDHIGQFPQIIDNYNVKEIWMSGDEHTSITYENTMNAILTSNAEYKEPRAGEIIQIGQKTIEVLNPNEITGNFHEGSISLRITYGEVSFIFTGDAEAKTESKIIKRGYNLNSQILQVGHHGSRTSSSKAFLNAILPKVAIYSAGLNNQYGHPHKEALMRLWNVGAEIYGTDVSGTIRIITDGITYEIIPSRGTKIKEFKINEKEPDEETQDLDCININIANKEKLKEIIHIGEVRANDLIEKRPFKSVDDMTRIYGIGPSRVNDIKEQGLACV